MNPEPPTFLLFDPAIGSWSTQLYSIEDLDFMPEVTEDSIVCTPDGKQQMTLAEARNFVPDELPELYHYHVVEHTKYIGLGKFDVEGLKKKLNEAARRGYRLVSVCAPTTLQSQSLTSVLNSGTPAGTALSLHGVVAIMEKRVH